MEKIAIIGSSGHAKVIADIVECEGRYQIVGLVDRCHNVGEQAIGYPVLGQDKDMPHLVANHDLSGVIVAIGDNFIRSRVVAYLQKLCPGLRFVKAIHPKAAVARTVTVGDGTVIMAGATVNPSCSVGHFCIINTNSSLDHDSAMEDFSSLAPNATTGGDCSIGHHSAVCIGAILIHGIKVGEHTVIGAGSTVLKSVPSFCVAYGSPARQVRKRIPGDRIF